MIGDRIRQARLAAGMTQGEVVDHLAKAGHPITKAALSKYEKKKSEPKQALLVSLARVLGVKPGHFLSEPQLAVIVVGIPQAGEVVEDETGADQGIRGRGRGESSVAPVDPLPTADAILP